MSESDHAQVSVDKAEAGVYGSSWLGREPFFYDPRSGRAGANINDVIDVADFEFDPEQLDVVDGRLPQHAKAGAEVVVRPSLEAVSAVVNERSPGISSDVVVSTIGGLDSRLANRIVGPLGLPRDVPTRLSWTMGFRRSVEVPRGAGHGLRRKPACFAYLTVRPLEMLMRRRDAARRAEALR